MPNWNNIHLQLLTLLANISPINHLSTFSHAYILHSHLQTLFPHDIFSYILGNILPARGPFTVYRINLTRVVYSARIEVPAYLVCLKEKSAYAHLVC